MNRPRHQLRPQQRARWQRVLPSVWAAGAAGDPAAGRVDLAIRLSASRRYLIPSPWSVVRQLVNEWPRLLKESIPTTYATLGGFAMSIAFGIPMALVIAYSRTVESFVYPLLVFSQSVPKIAIAPLFVVWFVFGIVPKVIAAFMLGFFPIVVSTVMVSPRTSTCSTRAIDEGEPAATFARISCRRRCRRSSRA